MGGKGGKLLFKIRAFASRTLGLLGTVYEDFEFMAAAPTDVFVNWHFKPPAPPRDVAKAKCESD